MNTAPEFEQMSPEIVLDSPEQITPQKLVEDSLLTLVLPAQVNLLEKISEKLDQGDWKEAFDLGLVACLNTIGTNLESVPSNLPEPIKQQIDLIDRQYRHTLHSFDMAKRIIENQPIPHKELKSPLLTIPDTTYMALYYTDEERESVTKVVRHDIKNLADRLYTLETSMQ